MHVFHYPLVVPACALTVGAWGALRLVWLPVPALVALVALGLTLDRRFGRVALWGGLGALAVLARTPALDTPRLADPRPATFLVRVVGHPRWQDGELSAWIRVERMTRGSQTRICALESLLTMPIEAPPTWGLGARLRVRGQLRPSNVYVNGAPQRGTSWRLRVPSARLIDAVERAPRFGRWADRLHRRVRTLWSVGDPSARSGGSGLARALLLGDPDALPADWVSGLRRAGLGHVLAVSGLHVGLLTAMVFLATTGWPRGVRAVMAVTVTLAYLLVVGPRPSVLRAALMVMLTVGAWLLARPPIAINILAAATIAMILHAPSVCESLSFRMTVAATAGILSLSPTLSKRRSIGPAFVRRSLATSVAAQLATAPFALPAFGWLAVSGWLINLLAVPCLGIALAVLVVATIVGLLVDVSRPFLPAVAEGCAAWVAGLAALPPGPWFGWPWVAPPETVMVGATLLLFLLVGQRTLRLFALLGVLVLQGHSSDARDPTLTMLDVGQGDALLLHDGSQAVLVDGGGWPRGDLGARVLVPALAVRGITRIDTAVLTHGDRDHCGGLVDLARYVPIATLWTSRHTLGSRCGQALARRVGSVRIGIPAETLRFGAWQVTVLTTGDEEIQQGRGDNDRSLVLSARARGRHFLLTGDIERAAELQIIDDFRHVDLVADVLKVAHHGSRTSTTRPWVAATRPRWALVSAGATNPYGHPADSVVDRLIAAGAFVLRTDRDGAWDLRIQPGGRIQAKSSGKTQRFRGHDP